MGLQDWKIARLENYFLAGDEIGFLAIFYVME